MRIDVFCWTKWDVAIGVLWTSRRWATRETIQRLKGQILADTGREVEEVDLDGEGMIEIGAATT